MISRFTKALDFAILFFILSGGLYFLYYLIQYNKPVYLLLSFIIYILSFSIRHFLVKGVKKTEFTEIGLFFVSMVFLAYTLYIFKLDTQIENYLPDKLLINSGTAFVFLLLMNLLPKGKLRVLAIPAFLGLIIFRDKLDNVFYIYPWVASLIIGTPYIYLLSLLIGTHKYKDVNNDR
jgi:peptidoglycan/LPS O-acetylase OafA/YrhL